MPTTAYVDWDGSWSATSIAASLIANGGTATTAAISHDGKAGTEVAISVAYGATASEGIKVYVLKEVNGTYEVVADLPWGFEMPKTVSTTHNRAFILDALGCGTFKIHITNNSGAQVTATVTYRQSVIGQATT